MGACTTAPSEVQPSDRNNTEVQPRNEVKLLKKANVAIQKNIIKEKNRSKYTYKLLLLGAGESGKSTLLKQMRLIHGLNYSEHELMAAKPIITRNVIQAMRTLAVYSDVLSDRGFDTKVTDKCSEIRDSVARMSDKQKFTVKHKDDFKKLWNDQGIKNTLEFRNEYQLIDTVEYLFDNIDNYCNPDYCPTFEDLIHCRQRTSGVNKIKFEVKDKDKNKEVFELYDVGGQKNERKKWIHFFDNTTAVIFVAALSGYNQTLWEENRKNRMLEAIGLFNSIVNMPNIRNSHIILFLNKQDLFIKKIASKKACNLVSQYFPEYKGPPWDQNKIIKFFEKKFMQQVRTKNDMNKKPEVYFHLTNATDTECTKKVFNACRQIVIKGELRRAQIL